MSSGKQVHMNELEKQINELTSFCNLNAELKLRALKFVKLETEVETLAIEIYKIFIDLGILSRK